MARAFADLVGTSLGTPNRGGDAGPYFAFDVPETGEDFAVGWYIPSIAVRNVSANPQFVDANATYAVAERIGEVPLPAGGLLLVSGIAALAAASRRRKGQA
ncbi:VPLPA-CTERM sorting domain-containing protein [Seohaeicola zhoushanensis]